MRHLAKLPIGMKYLFSTKLSIFIIGNVKQLWQLAR